MIVAFLCSNKLDLSIGCSRSHAAVPDLVLEQEWERLSERLLEVGAHESVNDWVDGGVGIGHAVGPRFDLIGGVVWPIVWIEGLEEDEDLDGTPADGEEQHDHHHHPGDFAPDA